MSKAITIDDRFLDVEFPDFDEYTFGAIETPRNVETLFANWYEDAAKPLTDAELRAIAEQQNENGGAEEYVTQIFDQGREGSCVGNAGAQLVEVIQAKAYGRHNVVPLSAMSLYQQIGRSARSGALVSDALETLAETGILPLDTDENRARFGAAVFPATGFGRPWPDGWKATAENFRLAEFHVVRDLEHLLSALARQEPVVVGRSGHSICCLRLLWNNNQWAVLYANSWGRWGQGAGAFDYGFGVDTLSKVKASSRWAFVARSLVARPEGFP